MRALLLILALAACAAAPQGYPPYQPPYPDMAARPARPPPAEDVLGQMLVRAELLHRCGVASAAEYQTMRLRAGAMATRARVPVPTQQQHEQAAAETVADGLASHCAIVRRSPDTLRAEMGLPPLPVAAPARPAPAGPLRPGSQVAAVQGTEATSFLVHGLQHCGHATPAEVAAVLADQRRISRRFGLTEAEIDTLFAQGRTRATAGNAVACQAITNRRDETRRNLDLPALPPIPPPHRKPAALDI